MKKGYGRWWRISALAGVMALLASACGGGTTANNTNAAPGGQPPTAKMKTQSSIGKGEGQLNLIGWPGYTEPEWVKPFEQQTGCQVHAKSANTSDEMVTLMRGGGGGQYDMVSASGDADLRLIYGGDVKPVNVNLIPAWNDFFPQFQGPSFNTISGAHYGVSLQWGPNVLLYNTKKFSKAPPSWSAIYSPKNKGQVTVPDNPIQIADAALYLSKTKPSLGIADPYELTQPQFQAVINLLKQQRPLVRKYWALASQEISMFKNGDASVGAAWPFQTSSLEAVGAPVAETIPKEGATGWADSWLLATKAPHPNCAYMWMKYISSPKPQAQQATNYGETPVNSKACPIMDHLTKGSCDKFHANDPSYSQSLAFWKTPLANCGDGKTDCVPYADWQQAWTTEVTG
ncbi:MAG TPA: ABC transporter substrate-binding protein [Actinomycetota bacterium]|nr:ABC transporter substrate-binding protein [Actinomycetota bacterium]